MSKCIVCGKEIPATRRRKDTCSSVCALDKMEAWIKYLQKHKAEIQAEALKEYARA